jgi:DNA replication and repair protein RecF
MFTALRLQHFRSYDDFAVDLAAGVNIVVGPNASGKTNMLEALLLLCRAHSYRARDSDMVQFGEDWARLDGIREDQSRTLKLQKVNERFGKTFELDGVQTKRLKFEQKLPVVLFEPEHMRLLTGSPRLRRDFLDTLLEQLYADFGALRRSYERALLQRNTLLKTRQLKRDHLFVWNVRLSQLGAQLVNHRRELIDQLNKQLPTVYGAIAQRKTRVELQYHATITVHDYASALLRALERSSDLDRQRGFTVVGPHRDDFTVNLAGHDAATSASRGETRTLVLSIKLLELARLQEMHTKKPLLLLDDVFSELDGARRQALTREVRDIQTIITTTDADLVVRYFSHGNVIALGKPERPKKRKKTNPIH